MKIYIFLILILTGFFSCLNYSNEISHADFELLLRKDSISDIMVADKHEAKIKVRVPKGDERTFKLKIESPEIFRDSLIKIRERLSKQNINPKYESVIYNSTSSSYLISGFIIFLVSVVFLFFLSVIDVLKNQFSSSVDKLIWLIVVLIPLFGPILYLIIGKKQRLQ